ncbi:MAG TPA: MASE3 domain-containing protein [Candidatus Deferrimicrobium sp.]|nr:MASE3 domain-containing protein [Candidatus Deferrimicrobium sp.]
MNKIQKILLVFFVAATLIGLFISYLLLEENTTYFLIFHSLTELFSIIVGLGIFMIAWNSRQYVQEHFYIFLGISFLFVSITDLFHTLAYKGMNIFIGYDANLPTQLWIFARFLQSISLLLSIFIINRKMHDKWMLLGFGLISALFIGLIFGQVFPVCYIEGVGLTAFKKISEYVIVGILSITIFFFYKKRKDLDLIVLRLIIFSLLLTIGSELSFTFYVSVFGISNFTGHIFKIFAFYCIYRAIIVSSLTKPYNTLFRNLKQSENTLLQERNALLRANKQIETIIGTVPDGIIFIDTSGQIVLMNTTISNLLKALYHENITKGQNIFKFISGNRLLEAFKENCEAPAGKTTIIELEDGKYYELHSEHTHITEDLPLGCLFVIHDVTEYIELENIRKQIISTVSHELRTPLTVIVSCIQNLMNYEDRMSEEQKKSLKTGILKSSDILTQMIEDLLIAAKIEEGRVVLQWVSYELSGLIKDIPIQMQPILADKQMEIDLQIDGEIQLYGDPKKISQVFRILLDNAIKYSPDKSQVKISTTNQYQGQFNPKGVGGVLIQISDSGLGIKEKDMANLFKRFFRAEEVGDTQGTGLGLHIAREFVRLHEGEIFIESKFGKGTDVFVFLPKLKMD